MYSIVEWNKRFETHKTRILTNLEWVPIPNRFDDDGYAELVDHPDGAAHYGVWVALVMVASKSPARGGNLARSGGEAHDIASLARVTRLKSAVLAPAIARLLKIKWMAFDGADAAKSGVDPAFDGADAALDGRRIEGNGMEWKGMEKRRGVASPKGSASRGSRFSGDTLPQDWFLWTRNELGWNEGRCDTVFQNFRDYWLAKAGKEAIKLDWAATWRKWCRTEADKPVARNGTASLFGHRPDFMEQVEGVLRERHARGENLL